VFTARRDSHGGPARAEAGRLGGRVAFGGGPVAELATVVGPPAGDGAVVEDGAGVVVAR
jgi:hypothetical protein